MLRDMHAALSQLEHRPWPIPQLNWTWRQSWHDLLFMHWPVPASTLRSLVPEKLELQEFEGTAWLGLVPFRMAGVMRRPWPDLPWVSAFPELNVRTYVVLDQKPGVWFLSLDASNRLAVWAARRFFHLPYYLADMALSEEADGIHYRSARRGAELVARYRPTSEPYFARAGSLEHWLTERYCLYAEAPDGSIWRNDVHHRPWPLQSAVASIERNTFLDLHGISIREPPALLHFAKRLDVVVWNADRAA
jgi:uncharacterized protein YqjF (DUF2071 family)